MGVALAVVSGVVVCCECCVWFVFSLVLGLWFDGVLV